MQFTSVWPRVRRLVVLVVLVVGGTLPPALHHAAAATPNIDVLFLGNLTTATSTWSAADEQFVALATSATRTIDIALYDFTRPSVRDALIRAYQRGVRVRVVGDNETATDPASGSAPFYAAIQATGIPVVLDTSTSSLMHNKFAVFDQHVLWTGSANFSDTGFTQHAEQVITIRDPGVAASYTTEFEEMFTGGRFSTRKSDNTAHDFVVDGSWLSVAFTPTDSVEQRILAAIASADVSVDVAMFTFTNDAIGQALVAAHQRGVRVAVLLDDTADGSIYSERDPLCAAGITVRVEAWPAKLHDKYAIVDAGTVSDPQVVTGSVNWTAAGVATNDENLLILRHAEIVSAYAADFNRLQQATGTGSFTCNVPTAPMVEQVFVPIVQRPQTTPPPTPSPTPSPVSGRADIVSIDYAPSTGTLDEYVRLRNPDPTPVTMTNWRLSDAAGNTYTFPSFTLGGYAEVRVWTKSGTNTASNLYWGRNQAVWNNTGDTAYLHRSDGVLVATYGY
jgi:phosphatidylserine/phosphatidylglycerophosphate/cardiolipin synthase-like enzyme